MTDSDSKPNTAVRSDEIHISDAADNIKPLRLHCDDGSIVTVGAGESAIVEWGPRGEFARPIEVPPQLAPIIPIGAALIVDPKVFKASGDELAAAVRSYSTAAVARKNAADNMQYAADELEHHEIATGEPPPLSGPKRDAFNRAIHHYNHCTDREIDAEEKLRRAALAICGEDPAIADDPL